MKQQLSSRGHALLGLTCVIAWVYSPDESGDRESMAGEITLATGFPLHRFEEFGKLSQSELEALGTAGSATVRYGRHSLIRGEGVVASKFYLLADGWVAASHLMRTGRRQILKVHLPGDAVGTPSMGMKHTVEELTCLTDATLIEMPFDRFWRLFEQHPRMGARFMLSIQLERIALMDRLASTGQTNAAAQLATFLLDLADRLASLGRVMQDSFEIWVSQEQVGNVLGLTAVHVNRTFRLFVGQKLIARDGRRISIIDRPALERLADRSRRVPYADQRWLPESH